VNPDIAQARACAQASADVYSLSGRAPKDSLIETQLAHVLIRDITGPDQVVTKLLAFRGTANPLDFVTDFRIWLKPANGFRVHAGFLTAWQSVENRILDGMGASRYLVTGHSLGGALAALCALAIESRVPNAVTAVHTFGQPRVGNLTFALVYRAALSERTWRWVNEEDVVARLPGRLSGYCHAGQEVFMPSMGPWRLNPPLWFKLASDLVGAYREWRDGRIALLADHHIAAYQAKVVDTVQKNSI